MKSRAVSGMMLTLLLVGMLTVQFKIQLPKAQEEGLIAYFPFNGNADDESGHGNNGTVYGATLTEDRFGNASSAHSFDGVDDYVEVSSFQNLTFNEVTILVWVKPVSEDINNNRIITIHDGVTPDYHYFDVETTTFRSIAVYIDGDEFMDHDWTLSPDIWTLIGVTYDCSTVKLYVDGELVETGVKSASPRTGILYIGGVDSPNYAAQIWDGIIDDVAIYNKALSSEEIWQRYYDSERPTISFLSPENKTYPVSDVPLTFTVSEPTDWIGCSLDGQANCTIVGNTTLSSLLDGAHYVAVYANNTVGNMGESNIVYFTVDTTPPSITEVSQTPSKNNVLPENEVIVAATVIDAVSGVEQVCLNYTNGNGTWLIIEMTSLSAHQNVWIDIIPSFPYGTNVTYVILAEDNTGNTVTSEELGYEYQYQVIPEFPSFLVLPLFMIATLLAVIIYRRKYSE